MHVEGDRLGRAGGYVASLLLAAAVPVAIRQLGLPSYAFEQLALLVAVLAAVRWGAGPAVAAAVTPIAVDRTLYREMMWDADTGLRDATDLLLFLTVALAMAWLVGQVRERRLEAERLAGREQRIRQERDEVIAAISHDLRNPLTAIKGTAQIALRQESAQIEPARLFRRIDSAADRALRQVRTLADLRALEADGVLLDLELLDLGELAERVVERMRSLSDRHELRLSRPHEPSWVTCDDARVQGVLENLIVNAIKYSPAGGPVDVEVTAGREAVQLAVRDHGVGIPPELRSRVFERYFRAETAAALTGGRGLGLYISSEIVRRHGGSIQVSDREGSGTVFTVRLPATPAPPEPAATS